jgi:hypothetical protein
MRNWQIMVLSVKLMGLKRRCFRADKPICRINRPCVCGATTPARAQPVDDQA